jgi:hypothetical protein
MRESNDWRLTNQESYLKGASLENRPYEPASQENDHDHCEFCFVKFTALAMPETRQEGYSTPDGYSGFVLLVIQTSRIYSIGIQADFTQACGLHNRIFAAKPVTWLCAPIRAAGSKHGKMGIRNLDV